MKSRVSAATWRAEMLCERALRTWAVFPEFDPALHVIHYDPLSSSEISNLKFSPPPSPLSLPCSSLSRSVAPSLLCGMDFGYRAPTVILWATLESGTLTILHERVETELILDTHVQAITRGPHPMPAWIGIDPAGNARNDQTGISAANVLRKAGLTVRARQFPTHAGLDLIRARLKPADGSPPRLYIHARCTKLIEALETYHYSDKDPTSLDPVKDGPDHAADALRYLITNLDRPYTTTSWNYLR
jgi:Terminase RNaseH-like domain